MILLDVMLPRLDGFDVCAELRRGDIRTPIILLTALAQEAEKVVGLDAGADDYVMRLDLLILAAVLLYVGVVLTLMLIQPRSPDGGGHDRAAQREANWYGDGRRFDG